MSSHNLEDVACKGTTFFSLLQSCLILREDYSDTGHILFGNLQFAHQRSEMPACSEILSSDPFGEAVGEVRSQGLEFLPCYISETPAAVPSLEFADE